METTYSSRNYTATTSATPHNSGPCHHFPSSVLETSNRLEVARLVNAALNVPLAVVAIFGNALVFLAVRRTSSIRLPSKVLLCNLVLTDLIVGLVVEPLYMTWLIMKAINVDQSTICIFWIIGVALATPATSVSMLTMTAIVLDRYVALFHFLRYREIVSTRRVAVLVTVFWLYALSCVVASPWNYAVWFFGVLALVSSCFLVNSVAFIKIYRKLRVHCGHQVHDQTSQAESQQETGSATLNVVKYRKTASTMLCIYLIFLICYTPSLCVCIFAQAVEISALTMCLMEFCYTIVNLNSCLNPFIYCFRLPEIRFEVHKQLHTCKCDRSPLQRQAHNNIQNEQELPELE